MAWHRVAGLEQIKPGKPLILTVANKEIGIFYEQSNYYAVMNICPHKQAEICKGRVSGTLWASANGEYDLQHDALVLRCPWHHWEFSLDCGKAVIPSVKQRLRLFPVKVEQEQLYVDI
ncbi:MAG: Rieske [2Fe-2S] protein [Paenibacillus sp.]|jgi:nitrite reductase/ring-hydroxylating ferredoxin subunit|nr:Rieske [2Fe-2S] protein [Paenibacillus sp.]